MIPIFVTTLIHLHLQAVSMIPTLKPAIPTNKKNDNNNEMHTFKNLWLFTCFKMRPVWSLNNNK